jgi:membrane protease YdiL (CAAX protease family)
MKAASKPNTKRTTQVIVFIFYLVGGMMVFLFGANTISLFPTNKNLLYEWSITALFLLLAVIFQRVASLKIYWKIASALFIVSAANAVNLSMGNFVAKILHVSGNDMRFLAIDKLSQSIPIILTIILLTLWQGDDLGSIFLKRGKLKQGLTFGLISFACFTIIFIVIVSLQANAQRTTGLFASGVSVSTIVSAVPWILVFCFTNGFMEELWFRGVSLGKLTPVLGRTSSIAVTALVFGSTHAAATYITPVQMLLFASIVIGLGIVNAYIMLKTDSIWGSTLFHAGYDLLTIIPLLVLA